MEPIRITYNELIYYVLLAGVVLGILLGLIPLILGIRKKNRKYGMYGFVGSVIGGAVSPVISIIVVSIFSWLILRKPKADILPDSKESVEKSGEVNAEENKESEIS